MKKGERASHKIAYLKLSRHPCRRNPGTDAGKLYVAEFGEDKLEVKNVQGCTFFTP